MSGLRMHWLGHAPFEDPASISGWFEQRGAAIASTRLWAGDDLPALADVDALVIMGGPMNVDEHDRYPWLVAEKAFIARAIEAGVPTLGICLGAQLIASALGAEVVPGPAEIGFGPIETAPEARRAGPFAGLPATFEALHWHGDQVAALDGPLAGAVALGSTPDCAIQGFALGEQVLALQCHMEAEPETLQAFVAGDPDNAAAIGSERQIAALAAERERFAAMNARLFDMLERLFGGLFAPR